MQEGQLTEGELDAWRGFLRAHSALVRALDTELEAEHGLPITSYDVLINIEGSAGERMRMRDLADAVLLSRSGLTRLVDRLEREGLVRREACDEDARGLFTVLTDEGVARLRAASPVHLRGVAEHAVGRLDDDEAAALAGLLAKMIDDEVDLQALESGRSRTAG